MARSGRVPWPLAGALFLSQGQHAPLHHRGLRIPRQPVRIPAARGRGGGHQRGRCRQPSAVRAGQPAAVHAAGRYGQDGGERLRRFAQILAIMEVANRETFIIDPAGRIAKHYPKVEAKGHSAAVLTDLKLLQDGTRQGVPQPGAPSMP